MKIRITFKDPDGIYEQISNYSIERMGDVEESEEENIIDEDIKRIVKKLAPWIDNKDSITIEFDTEKHSAVIIPPSI